MASNTLKFIATLGGAGAVLAASRARRTRRAVDLDGRVVLITGGSRGLGLALAEEFAGRGARLVLCARNEDDLERAAERLRRNGTQVLTVVCDVGDPDAVQSMFEQARERFGRVDVLINNAGTIQVGPVENLTLQDYHDAMDTMYWGVVHTTMAAMRDMIDRGEGTIVNIISIGGQVSVPHLLSYSGAKFAAAGFSEGLTAELACKGVRVVSVYPDLMRTGSARNALFKGQHRLEYSWFALGAGMPLAAMSAARAARRIVDAARHGDEVVLLGWKTPLASWVHGLMPAMTVRALGLVNRALPDATADQRTIQHGYESKTPLTQSFVTTLGRRAAREYNQVPSESRQRV